MQYELVIQKALERFERFQMPESPSENLSLLEELQNDLRGTKPFTNIDVLFIQHHLGPLIGRLNAMIANGMDPSRTWFVDIPYSTNINVIENWIRIVFGLKLWKSSVYMFSKIPNEVDWASALPIMFFAVIAATIGTLIPAIVAARSRPVEILRYE